LSQGEEIAKGRRCKLGGKAQGGTAVTVKAYHHERNHKEEVVLRVILGGFVSTKEKL